jgi:protein transport protein HofC
VLIALEVVSGFISYFILPKYEAIFADFGIPLPAVTILTVEVSHFLVKYGPLLLPLFLLQLGLEMLAVISAFGVLPWDLPLVGRFFHRRHSALVLRCLAYVVEGSRPMSEGLQMLARTYPVHAVRIRLRKVANDVQAGGDWCEALARYGFVRPPEAALLEAARRVGNLSWALRQAAENGERRLLYGFEFAVQWLFPLILMALAAIVFAMSVAYFTPLVVLIEKLAS